MRQPRFRKRLEKEHIAEQILTEQIISFLLTSSFMLDGVCSRSLEAYIRAEPIHRFRETRKVASPMICKLTMSLAQCDVTPTIKR